MTSRKLLNKILAHIFNDWYFSSQIPELDDCGKSFTFLYSDGSHVPVEAEGKTPVHEVLRGCEVHIGITENPSEVRDLQKLPSKWESQVAVSHNKAQPLRSVSGNIWCTKGIPLYQICTIVSKLYHCTKVIPSLQKLYQTCSAEL